METIIGIVVVVLGSICWLGQTLVVIAPDIAVKIGVNEPEDTVDKSMYLFERYSQGIMDVLLTWLLPASAVMMLLDYAYWWMIEYNEERPHDSLGDCTPAEVRQQAGNSTYQLSP